MKRSVGLFLAVVALVAAHAIVARAQDATDNTAPVENSKRFLQTMKEQTDRLEMQVEQARRERNGKKINCIEDRLRSLKALAADADGLDQKLRALSMQQRVFEANKTYARIRADQRLAEQYVKLVDQCFGNIEQQGGFTETVEQSLAEPTGAENPADPSASQPPDFAPRPLPLQFNAVVAPTQAK
jgi:hypothetical protein